MVLEGEITDTLVKVDYFSCPCWARATKQTQERKPFESGRGPSTLHRQWQAFRPIPVTGIIEGDGSAPFPGTKNAPTIGLILRDMFS